MNASITPEQLRAQLARNADGLRTMLIRAEKKSGKYNGFTSAQLREKIIIYDQKAGR